PLAVTGEADGRFDAGDAIEFYATATDSPYTTARVYWLVAGAQAGQRIKQVKSKGVAAGPTSFQAIAELRERTVYFASLRNGERACTVQARAAVTLGGFSSPAIRIMDITEAEKGGAREITAPVRHDKRGYSATVSAPGEGTRQLLAFTAAQMQRPAAIVADV